MSSPQDATAQGISLKKILRRRVVAVRHRVTLFVFNERIPHAPHSCVRSLSRVARVLGLVAADVRGQGQSPHSSTTPSAGDYATADIRVITPGVVFTSGLPDLAAAFSKETGKNVGINTFGMGTIVDEIGKRTPPPDVIVLPFQLMNTLAIDGGVLAGTMEPFGRHPMGLAVKAGAPKPDISTPRSLPPRSRARRP